MSEVKTKSQEVAADIAALLRARNPLLWIVTREEARVEPYLFEAAFAAGYVPHCWDCGQGATDVEGKLEQVGSPDPGDMLGAITERAKRNGSNQERGLWIMRDMTPWVTGSIGIKTCRELRNLARLLPGVPRQSAQAVIVLSPSGDVPAELAGHTTVIDWPLPDRAEIAAMLDATIESLPDDIKGSAAPNGTRDAAIDAAVGLSGEEASACYAKSLVQLKRIDPGIVAKEKKTVIARERVIEWFDPIPGGLDAVGGLDQLKEWLISRKLAYSAEAREYGLPAPKGVLLVGIPGCLHGDTPIYDPVAHTTHTARRRWKDAKPFSVWALDETGNPVVALALPPVRYGKANMIEFTFDNGASITVTEKHRFISQGVELLASEVYEQIQAGVPCRLQTSSALDLEVRISSAQHLTKSATPGTAPAYKLEPHTLSLGMSQAAQLFPADADQAGIAAPLHGDDRPSTAVSCSSQGFTRVRTAKQVTPTEYYDFHVPVYENYWACGVWHHNCGKSLVAKAIPTAFGVPLLRLDLGALKSKFVGESEANLRRAFRTIEAIGRCVVWLDEVEKALSGATQGAADGGVSSDALGAILSWMQDRQGEAFVIATANEVRALPPELLRKGRFDEVWWVDLPNYIERSEVLKAALRQHGRAEFASRGDAAAEGDWDMLCDVTEGFTGSEIAALVPDALFMSFADGKREITADDLLKVAKSITPLSKTMATRIDELRSWAEGKARTATSKIAPTEKSKRAGRKIDL